MYSRELAGTRQRPGSAGMYTPACAAGQMAKRHNTHTPRNGIARMLVSFARWFPAILATVRGETRSPYNSRHAIRAASAVPLAACPCIGTGRRGRPPRWTTYLGQAAASGQRLALRAG